MSQKMDPIRQIIGEMVVKLCEAKLPVDKSSISEKLIRVTNKEPAGSERNRTATLALDFLAKSEA
ncbi:hypothetical protein [Budvicia aquatica]|uniref:hypothetical protein n=1 Tax=Budvicia aquatica TaxID=82979 RepID=UPI00207FF55B|nr:hypothetical protein [Budvicia aquatica]GKX50028.1 hypothetical protein SOASR029_03370 [Budvicia aquatica]